MWVQLACEFFQLRMRRRLGLRCAGGGENPRDPAVEGLGVEGSRITFGLD